MVVKSKTEWPEGFNPEEYVDAPAYLIMGFAHTHFAAQVRTAALNWASANLTGDEAEWAEGFADWAAEKSGDRYGNYTMPPLGRWWKTYYAEPIVDEADEDDKDEDD